MGNHRVLIAQKEDKTEFKIQEYKQNPTTRKWSIDANVAVYEMSESGIIGSIDGGNDIYRTLYELKLTRVKTLASVNESTGEITKHLITESNSTADDNLNNLPTYK